MSEGERSRASTATAYDDSPTAPGIRLHVGISGSGKTFALKRNVFQAVAAGMPIVVIDRMEEWDEVPSSIREVTQVMKGFDPKHRDRIAKEKGSLAIVHPFDAVASSIAAVKWAKDFDGVAGVAIPEAHRVLPNDMKLHRIDPGIEDAVCAWRHRRIAMWLDTQRISLLNRTVTEQARELLVFATIGNRDRAILRELGDDELEAQALEAAMRLRNGQAGWHIKLGLIRVPPYELTRV